MKFKAFRRIVPAFIVAFYLSGVWVGQQLKYYNYGKSHVNRLGMKFVFVKPGMFFMGSPAAEQARGKEERRHCVVVTRGYWMQNTPVTQKQWNVVMGDNPACFSGCDDCPVESVSWDDVQLFISALNRRESKIYRLPTEAEGEKAARAGKSNRFSFGDDACRIGDYAWYRDNSEGRTRPVGSKRANALGLQDVHGNVWEWSQSRYGRYPFIWVVNPSGPRSSGHRAVQGGSWKDVADNFRSASRRALTPDTRLDTVGFRLAFSVEKDGGIWENWMKAMKQ